jgi:23S rRNA (cytidine1920-2'-O)/16S rRNA (cytidine1409-2'-O)-methyltransferase
LSERLDIELVVRGLARSRNHAHQLIEQGRVSIDGKSATKPAQKITEQALVELSEGIDYVSRAGLKLRHALEQFQVSPSGTVLDAGASTGGFTQVLLEHGANAVVAIDVGCDQLDHSLRLDPRVTSLEGVNLRSVEPEELAVLLAAGNPSLENGDGLPDFSLVVADLSFISLTLVLPNLQRIAPEAEMILLIKPQYEVGKHSLRAGIVTDSPERERALRQVIDCASDLGYEISGLVESPMTGTHGNVEYLLWISRTGVDNRQQWEQEIAARARRAS